MKYKLIAIDLDGTLLSTDGDISDRNLDAVRDITEKGVLFVPVTGRAMYEMPKRVTECPYIRYIVSSNGAVIYDKKTGEKLTHNFTSTQFAGIFSVLKEYETVMTVHCDMKSFADSSKITDEALDYYRINDYYKNHIRTNNVIIDNFDVYFSQPREVEMLTVYYKYDSELEECKSRLEAMGDIDITSSVSGSIEIIRHGALKGAALVKLARKLSIELSDIIAAGDSKNDISMLEKAGLSLAASNGTDAAKAAADKVICSCNEDIAAYIRDNYLA